MRVVGQGSLFEADGGDESTLTGPGGRALTPEQAAAVRARSGSGLLYANAGSGKTAVIVERFVRAVLEDGCNAARILAITFTDKAAGELRQRVRERFLELGRREEARAAEGAQVSTIHGFCARLLRAHPFAAGIDPEFRVLDEAEGARLRADSFSAALAGFLDSAARSGPAALELAAAYRPDRLRKLIDVTHARLRSRGQTAPALPPVAPRLVPPGARERLMAACDALAGGLAGETASSAARARAAVESCRSLLAGEPEDHPLPGELEAAVFKPGNAAALGTAACGEYLDALAAYRTAVADSLAAKACRLLDGLLAAYGTEYERRKRERSGLDFEDLELMARDLLAGDAAVRESHRERFDLVMVDEFQDTNGRQLEVLELLERDNLFTVGDEFQSIYGFRHADVSIFRARRRRLEPSGRVASLAVNFRARGPLLDVLNAAFGPLFGEAFVPLRDGRPDARDAAGPLVELLVTDQRGWEGVDLGDGLPPGKAWRQAEARLLAHRVRALVDAGEAEPGEIAVLLRALTDLPTFERALEDQGLPTYVAGGGGYWSAQQVRDLLAYAGALANPRDEVRMFALLASPIVGMSSDGLALLARARRGLRRDAWWALEQAFCPGGDGSGGLAETLPGADADRLRAFCPWFAAERAAAPRRALAEVLERAVVARGYDLHALSLRGGARRMANVRKLLRLAGEYEAHERRDLRGFLDWVAVREDAEVAEGEAPVESEDVEAVRLMSIHAAKGLEFPVVCVADTGRQGPYDAPDLHVGADGRIGLRIVSLDGRGVPALDYAALQEEATRDADAEERRIFYVAATRARERLIVSGSVPSTDPWPVPRPNGAPIAWLGPALAPGVQTALTPAEPRWEAPTGVACALNATSTVDAVLPRAALRPAGRPAPGPLPPPPGPEAEPVEQAPRPLPVRTLSYSGLESYARCGYRFYLERVLRLPAVETGEAAAGGEGLSALLRGTLAHELLEELDFGRPEPPGPEAVAALAGRHGAELAPEEAEELAGLVAGFASSGLCRRLASCRSVQRETAFAFPLALGEGEVLVNGVVDVLAHEGDRALVVDYKSDRLDDGDEPARRAERDYRTQRVAYALAALRDGAGAVEVVHCFLERPDAPVGATFSRRDAAGLEQEVAALAAGVAAGDFPVTGSPHRRLCRDCPGRDALCSWEPDMTLRDPP